MGQTLMGINQMQPKRLLLFGLLVATLSQLFLFYDLLRGGVWISSYWAWLILHGIGSAIATFTTAKMLEVSKQSMVFKGLLMSYHTLIPVAAPIGSFIALWMANVHAQRRHREPDYWVVTPRVKLPYITPTGRQATRIDSRGFEEQLMYSNDSDLYNKVLSVSDIKASLSVGILKQAMRHKDERIRLTAYNMLDRKVTSLNKQIQALEAQVATSDGLKMSNAWLQIASNYWELLTLEKDEPVARRQLLDRACHAAIQSVGALATNRNAHFVLGRISIMQGNTRRANVALNRAKELGMPDDKVVPYLAEAAFVEKKYHLVRSLLQQLDPAIKRYPPLSHVAEFWT